MKKVIPFYANVTHIIIHFELDVFAHRTLSLHLIFGVFLSCDADGEGLGRTSLGRYAFKEVYRKYLASCDGVALEFYAFSL